MERLVLDIPALLISSLTKALEGCVTHSCVLIVFIATVQSSNRRTRLYALIV